MSKEVVIEVGRREVLGKNAMGRLRRGGRTPGVVYGGGRDPVPVEFDPRVVEAVLDSERGLNTLIQLRLAGRDLKRMVMLREVQVNPVTERLLHADFYRVDMDQKVDVNVPVHLEGTPIGVKDEGGMLAHVNRELNVRVLPGQIPDSFDVDVSGLHLGQHLEAGEIELPAGVELLSPPTETIVTVIAKIVEEEPVVAEEEEAAAEAAEGETPEGEEPPTEGAEKD